jgi:hypothetical protein
MCLRLSKLIDHIIFRYCLIKLGFIIIYVALGAQVIGVHHLFGLVVFIRMFHKLFVFPYSDFLLFEECYIHNDDDNNNDNKNLRI